MTNSTGRPQQETRPRQRPLRRLLSRRPQGDEASRAVQAVWKEAVIAESDDTVVVEGNHYFPRDSVRAEYLRSSSHHSVCPWKGTASYYDVVVDGQTNRNAVWFYPTPKPAAERIADRVAFWRGVEVRSVE